MLLVDTGVSRLLIVMSRRMVVAETAWMVESRLGVAAESAFLNAVAAGLINVIDLTRANYGRCVELIDTYADLGLGLIDASLVTAVEQLSLTKVTTLNHRDFAVVRPSHVDGFELLPGQA